MGDEWPSTEAGTVPSLLEQPGLQPITQPERCRWVKLSCRSRVPASPMPDKAAVAVP